MKRTLVFALLFAATTAATSQAQAPRKETVAGVRNFTVVDPTIGCAGATEVAAIPGLAARGYKAIVNLREASEAGAAIDESKAAAAKAGIRYVHLPFNGAKPDPSVVDAFIKALADPANQPAFIHSGSANRDGGLLMAKLMVADGWTEARAYEEAAAVGLTSAPLRQFVVEYAASRK
jgi:protein tyrosine phosphatase (PTP) superfamily phosphohydrolase (DUF442 family)